MTTQYRDEQHGVVRAITAGDGGNTKPAAWQKQYRSGHPESIPVESDHLIGMERLLADSMTHALIRRAVSPRQYLALLLKYSPNEEKQIAAARFLARVVGTAAGPKFKQWAVAVWGLPALRQGKYSKTYNWDQQDVTDRTLIRWRTAIHDELNLLRKQAMDHLQVVFKDNDLIEDR